MPWSYVISAGGFDAAYITAGCVGLFAVGLSLFLQQPGRGDTGGGFNIAANTPAGEQQG